MKPRSHSNPAVRFGAILALGLLAGSGAQAASATARAAATIIAPETIRVSTSSDRVQIDTDETAGFLAVGSWREMADPKAFHIPTEGTRLEGTRSTELGVNIRDNRQAVVLVYHHY